MINIFGQESALSVESDPGAVIAAALKRTPGAGRERVIDPDNLVSPACAPEAYGGGGVGGETSSNPITGVRVARLVKKEHTHTRKIGRVLWWGS